MSRLKDTYQKEVVKALAKEFSIANALAVPRITKITINMGIGDLSKNKELKEALVRDMSLIAGQKPSDRQARTSIATFNLRKGMVVGLAVTLRGEKMYDFYDRLVNIVLPRLRDFRGVKKTSFDRFGNFTLGVAEHTVFPEIDAVKAAPAHGMEIVITTNAGDVERGKRLLELLGMPFTKD